MAYKRHANVSTIGFEVSNNMFSLTAPFTLWQAITGNVAAEYQNSKGQVQWRSEYLKTRDVGNDGWATVGLEWRGPSYANRMGNGPESSGDGWTYRGRGPIQLTGKDNYRAFAKDMFDDWENLFENPDWVTSDRDFALMSAIWFWNKNKLNVQADAGDIKLMTKKINGGYIGLEDRIKHYNHAIEVLTA